MAKVVSKCAKCAKCIYATIGEHGNYICSILRRKKPECKHFKEPNNHRYEMQYEGYHLIMVEVNYFDTTLREERYTLWLTAYPEPFSFSKKRNPVYRAHAKPYTIPLDEITIKSEAIKSFETFYLGDLPKA